MPLRKLISGRLAGLDDNFPGLGWSLRRFTFQYPIKKPDNETVGGENNTSGNARTMKNVAQFERNKCRGGKDHEEFGPPLLQIHADPFGEQHRRIEEAEKRGGAKNPTARENVLEAIEQIVHDLAVLEQNLVGYPIRKVIHPNRPRIQKKNRDAENEKQKAFRDLEKGDQLEIANAVFRPQNFEISCLVRHS